MRHQREGDKFLMMMATGNPAELLAIKKCRLYLKAVTLADVLSADGNMVKEGVLQGIPLKSCLHWPNQGKPGTADWRVWNKFLKTLLWPDRIQVLDSYLLGKWHSTHVDWMWMGNIEVICNTMSNATYVPCHRGRLGLVLKMSLVKFNNTLYWVEVKQLGIQKIVVTNDLKKRIVETMGLNIFNENIPNTYRRFFGGALDYHKPEINCAQVHGHWWVSQSPLWWINSGAARLE